MARAASMAAALALGLLLSSCGSAAPSGSGDPGGSSTGGRTAGASAGSASAPAPSTPASPAPSGSAPTAADPAGELADSVTLRSLGFSNGPLDTVPVPRAALITARVDQPNVVTLIFVSPDANGLFAFYRDTLPGAGYRIEASDAATATLSFSGSGWRGNVTGTGADAALVLRPD